MLKPALQLQMLAKGLGQANPVGKSMQAAYKTGAPFREQLVNIRNQIASGPGAKGYVKAADEMFAEPVQKALMHLADL